MLASAAARPMGLGVCAGVVGIDVAAGIVAAVIGGTARAGAVAAREDGGERGTTLQQPGDSAGHG